MADLRVGQVTIRRIEELVMTVHPSRILKPAHLVAEERATGRLGAVTQLTVPQAAKDGLAAEVAAVGWLSPHWADAENNILVAFQMYVVETPGGVRIAVDTCAGNDKDRAFLPVAHKRSGPFLDDLRKAGCPPESIDYVLCTHLHFDHVGWNTVLRDGAWVPTFPNAKYLFAKREWEHFTAEAAKNPKDAAILSDSVQPVVDAGLHRFVEQDHVIADEPHCRVYLRPTVGHTPGHVSVVIESAGAAGLITGDCVHHPLQLARPRICSFFDADSPQADETRAALLDGLAGSTRLLIGTHFAPPCAGFVDRDGDAYRLRPATAAAAAEPPPSQL